MPENANELPERTEGKVQQLSPDHWSVFLRCTICFGFLESPHTLKCGHSFCKSCLKRLAEIARDDSPTQSLRRLNLSCPTCRHPFRARTAISGRIHTTIVLKQLVELWKKECKAIASSSIINIRSVGCQTMGPPAHGKKEAKPGVKGPPDLILSADVQEELSTRMVLSQENCFIILKRVLESLDELTEPLPSTTTDHGKSDSSPPFDGERREHSDSESSAASSSSDANVGGGGGGGGSNNPSLSNVSLPDRLGHGALPRMIYLTSDNCPGRLLLMSVWSIYSLVIVALAEASLPYVILFTLFFFLLVLR